MNEKPREVFLCPDCGGLSTAVGDGNAVCSDCSKAFALSGNVAQKVNVPPPAAPKKNTGAIQRNIALKSKAIGSAPDLGRPEMTEELEPELARSNFEKLQKKQSSRRRKKLKKRNKIPARVYAAWIGGWLLAVAIILSVVILLQNQFDDGDERALEIEERLGGEELAFYRREYPQVLTQFSGFARARTASEMVEFTRDSDQLSRKMNSYFKDRSPRRPTSGLKTNPIFWNVAFEETPGFVEVVWDGKKAGFFEAVFVKKGEKWQLDWEQYVRFSSESWSLFRDKIGRQQSGIFRLYVEKISEGEGKNFEPWMEVKLSPPEPNEQRRKLEESELIYLGGEEGLYTEFASVFADLSGRSEGFSQLWKRDPRGLRRVTVELEWQEDPASGEERMVIKRLLAENWRKLEVKDEQAAFE